MNFGYKKPVNHDCSNCGKKEAGYMSSTQWIHDFGCCSDACGFAFKEKWKELSKTGKGRSELLNLWNKLQSQSTYILSGEPYAGYKAEILLKSLGR